MRNIFATLFLGSILLTACSKTETSPSTAPADYAETEQDLIQNPARDSSRTDSMETEINSAMPPQSDALEESK